MLCQLSYSRLILVPQRYRLSIMPNEPSWGFLEPPRFFFVSSLLSSSSIHAGLHRRCCGRKRIDPRWGIQEPSVPGGEGRIRTSEGIANRFTVCPLWPLGNLSDSRPKLRFRQFPPGQEKEWK